jgi:putative ABC transport system permease protein
VLKNYVKIAFRNFKNNRGYSLINFAGLTVGMACFLLIALWARDELSFDRWHEHADRTFWVVYKEPASSDFSTYGSGALGPALRDSYPEITHFSRHFGPISSPLRFEDKVFNADVAGVDPGFFDIFSFRFLRGKPDEALSNPDSIVLTESTARKYFGTADPIGKTMNFEWWGPWYDFKVTAVIADLPGNTHLDFDFLLPLRFVTFSAMAIDTWDVSAYRTYVRLRDGVAVSDINPKIAGIVRQHVPGFASDVSLFPTKDIHLQYSRTGAKAVTYVRLFLLIGGLVLLMACINFVNLSTARSAKRAREVGLRKVVGAGRGQLVRQFLGESLFLATAALVLSLGLVSLFLPAANAMSGKSLALRLDGALGLQMLGIALLVGIGAGVYPAFHLSAYQPARVVGRPWTAEGGNPLFRKILVVVQFGVSVLLLISSTVILRQSDFLRHKDWGINTKFVVNMDLRGGIRRNYRAIREELLSLPHVEAVCITNGSLNKRFATDEADWEGRRPEQELSLAIHAVDYDYDDVFGVEIAEGRFFSPEFAPDATEGVVLNQTAVRLMGLRDPIGKRFAFPLPFDPDRNGRIIGVVKDFHFRSLHEPIAPLVLVVAPGWITDLYVRLDGSDLAGCIASIERIIKGYAPDAPFDYRFVDDEIDGLYSSEVRMGRLVRAGTALAALIACLGLFGLASFTAEQRTREIGIRKVLGSTTADIVGLLTKDFLIWVAIANLLAWPVAWWAAASWLRNFPYRVPLSIWPFVLAGGTSMAIAWLTVSAQSFRAAASNPADSLRSE